MFFPFQPFWLCLQYFFSGLAFLSSWLWCFQQFVYRPSLPVHNCTVQLDTTRHQPGLSFVNETSPIFSGPLLILTLDNCGTLPTSPCSARGPWEKWKYVPKTKTIHFYIKVKWSMASVNRMGRKKERGRVYVKVLNAMEWSKVLIALRNFLI